MSSEQNIFWFPPSRFSSCISLLYLSTLLSTWDTVLTKNGLCGVLILFQRSREMCSAFSHSVWYWLLFYHIALNFELCLLCTWFRFFFVFLFFFIMNRCWTLWWKHSLHPWRWSFVLCCSFCWCDFIDFYRCWTTLACLW